MKHLNETAKTMDTVFNVLEILAKIAFVGIIVGLVIIAVAFAFEILSSFCIFLICIWKLILMNRIAGRYHLPYFNQDYSSIFLIIFFALSTGNGAVNLIC